MTINVTNQAPSPGTALVTGAAISFDVTFDPPEDFETVLVKFNYGTFTETPWDSTGFDGVYAGSSQRLEIPGGHRYTIRRSGAWPGIPTVSVVAFPGGGAELALIVKHAVSGELVPGAINIITDAAADEMTLPPQSEWPRGYIILRKRDVAADVTVTCDAGDEIFGSSTGADNYVVSGNHGFATFIADDEDPVIDGYPNQ